MDPTCVGSNAHQILLAGTISRLPTCVDPPRPVQHAAASQLARQMRLGFVNRSGTMASKRASPCASLLK